METGQGSERSKEFDEKRHHDTIQNLSLYQNTFVATLTRLYPGLHVAIYRLSD
jgi:hypothetical protein